MQLIYCLYYIFALPLRFFLFIIFLFLVLAFYFSCWEVPLAFLIKLIWWFCTLFTLACLLNLPPKILPLSSVQFSRSVVSDSLQPHESQHARPPCPSPSPGVHSNSHPSSQWCHPAISSTVVPFSSCPQSLPASECFPMSQLFAWGGQSTGVSVLASFLPKNTQDWSPCSPRDSQESSPTPQFKSISSSVLSFLHSPTLTSIRDHRKNHSLN